MDKHDIFINEYNKVENLLSKLPGAPNDANMKWFEDSFEDMTIKNKLFYCRITRNYIQHNTDYITFVGVTDAMISFIKDMYKYVYARLTTIDENMISLKKCIFKTKEDNIVDIIKIMDTKKIDYVPILENGIVTNIFSKDCVVSIFNNSSITSKSKLKDIDNNLLKINKNEIKFMKSGTLLEDAENLFKMHNKKESLKMIIVTDTGTAKGQFLGLLTEYDL